MQPCIWVTDATILREEEKRWSWASQTGQVSDASQDPCGAV